MKLRAKQDSWITLKADGKGVMNNWLRSATEKSFRAHDRIDVILGDASVVEVSFNGKALDLAAGPKQVRHVVFTPAGLQPDAPEQR